MKINQIKPNPNNPRFIRDERFDKLKKSIEQFPQMMKLRPIIINDKNIILGGNMRFKALIDLGFKDIPEEWVKKAEDLTEQQQREFIIKDNVGFGSHDWDVLANEWNSEHLEQWGLEIPSPGIEEDEEESKEDELITFKIQVAFDNVEEQLHAKQLLEEKGYKVKLL